MKFYNPNREERAFLYQEAQDLEPLMKDLGSLSVLVEEEPYLHRYRVTFVVAPESVAMKVQATDRDLFAATIAAKDEALRQLNAIVNAMPRHVHLQSLRSKSPAELLH